MGGVESGEWRMESGEWRERGVWSGVEYLDEDLVTRTDLVVVQKGERALRLLLRREVLHHTFRHSDIHNTIYNSQTIVISDLRFEFRLC